MCSLFLLIRFAHSRFLGLFLSETRGLVVHGQLKLQIFFFFFCAHLKKTQNFPNTYTLHNSREKGKNLSTRVLRPSLVDNRIKSED